MTASVSVVIPTYNTAEMTLECCRALLRQTLVPEIVVVDDGGRDDTLALVHALDAGILTIRNPVNSGYTVSVNRGVAATSGAIVTLLNSDAIVPPGFCERVAAELNADERIGVCGAQLVYPDGKVQWSAGAAPTLSWLFALTSGAAVLLRSLPVYRSRAGTGATSRDVFWVTGAALSLRRSVWNAVGGLDERYLFYGQDLDLCVRVRGMGMGVVLLRDLTVVHRHGGTVAADDAELRADPTLLWPDLLTWARAHRTRSWAAMARLVMIGGGILRIVARSIFSRGPSREDTTRSYRRALRAILAGPAF